MKKIPRGQTPQRQAYMKAYVESHPKRDRRAYKKAYDEANKDHIVNYRLANQEKLNAQKKKYYQDNRERMLAYHKTFDKENKEKILDYQARHYIKNSEKIKARVSEYRKANPEKKAHLENKRRAKKFKNGGSHTIEQRLEKFASFNNRCAYCGEEKKLTVDHIVSLSKGGTDDIENIVPACRPCNSSKNTKSVEQFLKVRSKRFAKI